MGMKTGKVIEILQVMRITAGGRMGEEGDGAKGRRRRGEGRKEGE